MRGTLSSQYVMMIYLLVYSFPQQRNSSHFMDVSRSIGDSKVCSADLWTFTMDWVLRHRRQMVRIRAKSLWGASTTDGAVYKCTSTQQRHDVHSKTGRFMFTDAWRWLALDPHKQFALELHCFWIFFGCKDLVDSVQMCITPRHPKKARLICVGWISFIWNSPSPAATNHIVDASRKQRLRVDPAMLSCTTPSLPARNSSWFYSKDMGLMWISGFMMIHHEYIHLSFMVRSLINP